tara:strand:- start:235 stop:498 length:264 start_codon:yes stop_codon:yes gene_type:complete
MIVPYTGPHNDEAMRATAVALSLQHPDLYWYTSTGFTRLDFIGAKRLPSKGLPMISATNVDIGYFRRGKARAFSAKRRLDEQTRDWR